MKKNEINITVHSGKMEGIPSISTSVLLNANCKKNAKTAGSICSHCYAHSLCLLRPSLAKALESNTKILSSRPLSSSEIPDTTGSDIFRLESFGDLNNETQLKNYMAIVNRNPKTRFTLYTKQYEIVENYFMTNPIPENFTLILSSLMVNKNINLDSFRPQSKFKQGQLKSFTVYDKEFLVSHAKIKINCGSRSCNTCRLCYNSNKVKEVREILKSDQAATEEYYNWKNPDYVSKAADDIEEIMNSYRK